MRRLLRDIAEGKALGDTTTLADPAVVARLKDEYEDAGVARGRGRDWPLLNGRAPVLVCAEAADEHADYRDPAISGRPT